MLKIALTKGRVEEQFTALLAQRGFDTSPLENKQRLLIIEVADQFEFILAKGPDVLTYLTNGVVDLGIVGSDILMEQDAESDELLDLKTGQCQFILASTEDFAQRYFARRGQDVAIIKLEGSVELAPLIGLADAIIDITETGRTLKENHLVIYDRLDQVSTRLVANPLALKQKRDEIYRFVTTLKGGN